jgi:hypothetical protein
MSVLTGLVSMRGAMAAGAATHARKQGCPFKPIENTGSKDAVVGGYLGAGPSRLVFSLDFYLRSPC